MRPGWDAQMGEAIYEYLDMFEAHRAERKRDRKKTA